MRQPSIKMISVAPQEENDDILRLSKSQIKEETTSKCWWDVFTEKEYIWYSAKITTECWYWWKDIIRRLSIFKIEEISEDACWWDVFTDEILPRLPAENLETLKTVSKNWLRIISNPHFVRLHLNNAYNQSHIRVLTMSWRNSGMNMYNINNINCEVETKQIPFPPLIRNSVIFKFLGSCDGLLCLFLIEPNKFAVYNPSTGKYFLVQPPLQYYNYTIQCSWFGRHPSSGEFVLILFLWDLDWKVGVHKFSGGSGSGSTLELIQSTPYFISSQFPALVNFTSFEEIGTLLHGALHWPAVWINSQDLRQLRLVICVYHLENNKYSEISPPTGPVQDRFKLGVNADGCLFAIFNSANAELELEMWVMKEYGVEQSWAKHANIVGIPYKFMTLSTLGLFPNGDLILDAGSFGLIKYNFNDNKVVRLITYHNHSRSYAIVCVDSLVSPTIVLSEEFKT